MSSSARKAKKASDFRETLDPIALQIQQEIEEFLKDLTLEFSFYEIFEILKRHEFKDRYGKNVFPLPRKHVSPEALKEIHDRLESFFHHLKDQFGRSYYPVIDQCFKFYTQTTIE